MAAGKQPETRPNGHGDSAPRQVLIDAPTTRPPAAPVAIGGVGGSGTRLVASMLGALGFHLGDDRNEAEDNLWFTLLFKRREILALPEPAFAELVELFAAALTGASGAESAQVEAIHALAARDRLQHDAAWLQLRADSMIAALQAPRVPRAWGWKEPNTHVVIDYLRAQIPGLRYIHVMRNGLDMAYSANQNQLALWGPHFLGREVTIAPRDSLAYWCAVHRRVHDRGAAMGADFLLLDYDHLCSNPRDGVQTLLNFLAVDASPERIDALVASVRPPSGIGRFKAHGLAGFDADDVAFVRALGFDTSV